MARYRGRHLKPRPKKRGPVVVATAATVSLAGPAHAATHTVRSGETLSGIAGRYGTTVTALVRANDLGDPNLIVAGAKLRLPGRVGTRIHVVSAGETLSGIAARYGSSAARLARANRLADPNMITIGQRLRVPAGGPVATTTARTSSFSIESSLRNQAVSHGVDPALVKGVAWQESGWNQRARSSAGAIGVMQVMPGTARWINCCLGDHGLNVRKADDNVHLGVMYLRHMLATMGSVKRALAGYYSGPGAVKRRLNPGQRNYARNVLALVKRFR